MNYKILDDMKTTNIKKVNYSITSVLCTLFSVLFHLSSLLLFELSSFFIIFVSYYTLRRSTWCAYSRSINRLTTIDN